MIVALAGTSMSDIGAVLFLSDRDLGAGDDGAGEGGAGEVVVFVDGVALDGGETELR